MAISFEGAETGLPKGLSSRDLMTFCSEFEYKVKYPFKRYVFLSPTEGDVNLDSLMNRIFQTPGYEAHKMCYHGDKPSHIHVKYYNETNAREAVELFKNPYNVQGIRVAATQLHEFLLCLYATESLTRRFPAWTLSVVDIEGTVEHCQPLSREAVRSLLVQFGDPRIFSYNVGHTAPDHVQALFSSMAEALGASIAHGSWTRRDLPESPKFCYRIRLIGSEKESELMRRFSRSNNVDKIFEMDYFVGNNPGELDVPSVPNYPINEHFNHSQYAHRGRNFCPSNMNPARSQNAFRAQYYYNYTNKSKNNKSRVTAKPSRNQSGILDKNKSGSTATVAENLPDN